MVLRALVNPEIHHIYILDQTMPATIIPGFYQLQFGLEFPNANAPNPKPLYLTNNGEGKQLTVEHPTGQLNQEVNYL